MTALERMRETFEMCTVMAGVEPDFECIYITKGAANALFDEAEAENAKLRELVRDAYACIESLCGMVENSPGCSMCPTNQDEDRACGSAVIYSRMRELGVDA